MSDVIVIGGGVVGLSIAFELARQGVATEVLDQGPVGREASWAGAGILPPGRLTPDATPESALRGLSHTLWDELSEQLRDATGIDNGYRRCGGLRVCGATDTRAHESDFASWQAERVVVERLDQVEAHRLEPALHPDLDNVFHLPELGQVRNPRHLKALRVACEQAGVVIREGCPATRLNAGDGQIERIDTPEGPAWGDRVCVTAGAWSSGLLADFLPSARVLPVRGQMLLLNTGRPLLSRVIEHGKRYLVPRPDGRVLVGSTEEQVGFDRRNTTAAIRSLIDFATGLAPALEESPLERVWTGFRPKSLSGLPYLGRVPGFDNLFVAAGHFRSGLQQSPGTALVMRQCLMDQATEIPLDDFSPQRTTLPAR